LEAESVELEFLRQQASGQGALHREVAVAMQELRLRAEEESSCYNKAVEELHGAHELNKRQELEEHRLQQQLLEQTSQPSLDSTRPSDDYQELQRKVEAALAEAAQGRDSFAAERVLLSSELAGFQAESRAALDEASLAVRRAVETGSVLAEETALRRELQKQNEEQRFAAEDLEERLARNSAEASQQAHKANCAELRLQQLELRRAGSLGDLSARSQRSAARSLRRDASAETCTMTASSAAADPQVALALELGSSATAQLDWRVVPGIEGKPLCAVTVEDVCGPSSARMAAAVSRTAIPPPRYSLPSSANLTAHTEARLFRVDTDALGLKAAVARTAEAALSAEAAKASALQLCLPPPMPQKDIIERKVRVQSVSVDVGDETTRPPLAPYPPSRVLASPRTPGEGALTARTTSVCDEETPVQGLGLGLATAAANMACAAADAAAEGQQAASEALSKLEEGAVTAKTAEADFKAITAAVRPESVLPATTPAPAPTQASGVATLPSTAAMTANTEALEMAAEASEVGIAQALASAAQKAVEALREDLAESSSAAGSVLVSKKVVQDSLIPSPLWDGTPCSPEPSIGVHSVKASESTFAEAREAELLAASLETPPCDAEAKVNVFSPHGLSTSGGMASPMSRASLAGTVEPESWAAAAACADAVADAMAAGWKSGATEAKILISPAGSFVSKEGDPLLESQSAFDPEVVDMESVATVSHWSEANGLDPELGSSIFGLKADAGKARSDAECASQQAGSWAPLGSEADTEAAVEQATMKIADAVLDGMTCAISGEQIGKRPNDGPNDLSGLSTEARDSDPAMASSIQPCSRQLRSVATGSFMSNSALEGRSEATHLITEISAVTLGLASDLGVQLSTGLRQSPRTEVSVLTSEANSARGQASDLLRCVERVVLSQDS